MASSDRFSRQASLVPRDQMDSLPVSVVGVGAIGRQVALQLASIGVRQMQIIDFDRVDDTNVTTQGYRADQIGQPKSICTAQDCHLIDPTIKLEVVDKKWTPKVSLYGVIFCCVDSISVRDTMFSAEGSQAKLFVDGRMQGEVMRILASGDPESRAHYPTTLFAQEEAHTGSCTAKSTIYTANVAAGLMVHQFTRWLRGMRVAPDVSFNMLSGEMFENKAEVDPAATN